MRYVRMDRLTRSPPTPAMTTTARPIGIQGGPPSDPVGVLPGSVEGEAATLGAADGESLGEELGATESPGDGLSPGLSEGPELGAVESVGAEPAGVGVGEELAPAEPLGAGVAVEQMLTVAPVAVTFRLLP